MALTKCAKCKREWQANSGVEPCPWCRASAAESSLAAMRQRAEELQTTADMRAAAADHWKEQAASLKSEKKDAIARAERAEEALRHLINKSNRVTSAWRHHGVIPPEDIHTLYDAQCAAEALESSPPAHCAGVGGRGGGIAMDQIKPAHIPDCEPQVDSSELMTRREHLEEEIKKALNDVKREALIAQMTTQLETYRSALEHIRDGSDAVCTECGWIGRGYFYCPSCNTLIRTTGADEIAAYTLAQGEKGEEDHISQPGKMVGERRLVELVKEAFLQGFDAKDSEVSAPTSEASYSERAEAAWECSETRADLAEMEQKS